MLPLWVGCVWVTDRAIEEKLGNNGASSADGTHAPVAEVLWSWSDSWSSVPLLAIQVNVSDEDGDLADVTITDAEGNDVPTDNNFEGGYAMAPSIPTDPCMRGMPTVFTITVSDLAGHEDTQILSAVAPGQAFDIGDSPHVTVLPASLCGMLSETQTFTVEPGVFDDAYSGLIWEVEVTDYTVAGDVPYFWTSWAGETGTGAGLWLNEGQTSVASSYAFDDAPTADTPWVTEATAVDVTDVSGVLTLWVN